MKNQKGFAPIIIVLIVALFGVGTYAVVNREVLKSYFEKGDKPTESQRTELKDKFEDGDIPTEENSVSGDKPTESQFKDTIDSSLNLIDDAKKPESSNNLFPEDKKEFTTDDAMKPVTFRWTAITPKPSEPITYRIKVWQLMQGQNGTQAMKVNKPIIEKDAVNITEVTVSGIYTGPCKPPYLCDYIWNVEAITRSGAVVGTSQPSTFSVTETTVSNENEDGTPASAR